MQYLTLLFNILAKWKISKNNKSLFIFTQYERIKTHTAMMSEIILFGDLPAMIKIRLKVQQITVLHFSKKK